MPLAVAYEICCLCAFRLAPHNGFGLSVQGKQTFRNKQLAGVPKTKLPPLHHKALYPSITICYTRGNSGKTPSGGAESELYIIDTYLSPVESFVISFNFAPYFSLLCMRKPGNIFYSIRDYDRVYN